MINWVIIIFIFSLSNAQTGWLSTPPCSRRYKNSVLFLNGEVIGKIFPC
jgi:hypothetical protein